MVQAGTSQNNSGVVLYEDKVNLHKGLSPEMEVFKDRIPEFRTSEKVFYFNGTEGIYKKPEPDSTEAKPQQGRRGWGRWGRGGQENSEYYTDFNSSETIDYIEFFGKEFLIKGEKKQIDWKITPDQKQVGSYLCMKAVHQDSTQTIEAWFTPMIPVSAGPEDYAGLPGLILRLDFDDGKRTITATDIQLKQIEEGIIVKPTKGKQMSKEKFEKLRDEKTAEREAEWEARRKRWMNSRD